MGGGEGAEKLHLNYKLCLLPDCVSIDFAVRFHLAYQKYTFLPVRLLLQQNSNFDDL